MVWLIPLPDLFLTTDSGWFLTVAPHSKDTESSTHTLDVVPCCWTSSEFKNAKGELVAGKYMSKSSQTRLFLTIFNYKMCLLQDNLNFFFPTRY